MRISYLSSGEVLSREATLSPTYECDVLVVGAGCAGVYAAAAAGRAGASVILIEQDANIGGMYVGGFVNSYYYGAHGGSFEAVDRACRRDRHFFAGERQPELKQICFTELLISCGVRLITECVPLGVYFEDATAVGIRAYRAGACFDIRAKMVIDATSDGHLIRMCPVAKRYGRQSDGRTVPFTTRTLFVRDGKYTAINADSGYMNQYDKAEFSQKVILSHADSARYLDTGEYLGLAYHAGVREGLSFEGEDTLHYEDILYAKVPSRVLFYAYSDLDKHGHDHAMDEELFQTFWVVSNLATVTARIPVPMGAVVPKGLLGIVSAGRCFSTDSYAQSAVRMNRDMFRMGECVGTAAAIAVREDVPFQKIDYEKYLDAVTRLGCFSGDAERGFGFDHPKGDRPYRPVRFDLHEAMPLLSTETPGVAIFSAFLEGERPETRELLAARLSAAEDTLTRYNTALALGVTGDVRALPVLRELVEHRDCFYFKDCRRSNQFRSASALCLLGRLGDASDIPLLESIVFDDGEFDRALYHTLKPNYLYYGAEGCNFVYFDLFTHAAAALVKIHLRLGMDTKKLHKHFLTLFENERIIRRVTDRESDSPIYIEIEQFQKYILDLTS